MNYYDRRREEREVREVVEWKPKTKIGMMVKNGEIKTIEQILSRGKQIKEVEIVDALLPDLKDIMVEMASVQRMTKNNRKQKFRATVIVGDRNGHVGLGVGKDTEAKPAIDSAIKDAKMNIMPVHLGCGSWECECGTNHSLPIVTRAKCGSSDIILKPAPRGVGIVAGKTVKAVLELAGVKDVWTFARGRTRDRYNAALATFNAIKKINKLKNVTALK